MISSSILDPRAPRAISDGEFLPSDPSLESAIRAKGEELLGFMEKHPAPGIFSRSGVHARVMEWAMKDPAFKTQLFRFVDVLPSLTSGAEIVRHLQEYLGDKAVELSPALRAGLAASSFARAVVAGPVRANVVSMARQFVAGETAAEMVKRFRKNARAGVATTIDLLGESVVSEQEADFFLERNLEMLDTLAAAIAEQPRPSFSDIGPDGALPRLNLSVKISTLTPCVHPADPEGSMVALKKRLRPILRRAAEVGAFINFDMESYVLKDLTLALFKSILEEDEFTPGPDAATGSLPRPMVGIALQAYLRDSERDLLDLIGWARQHRRPVGVRLIKGAYWDYETILAQQRNWPVPVWSRKAESDANFEKLSLLLLENIDIVAPAFASHNVRSCAQAIVQAERLGIHPLACEFQALYGMADELKAALLRAGHRVREYCPVGELLPGMAYLVRRLLENTSNEGFLRAKKTGEATKDQLLANPTEVLMKSPYIPTAETKDSVPGTRSLPFKNAANTDFALASNRDKQHAALERVVASLGRRWPLFIGGREVFPAKFVPSINPARPSQVIGYWGCATVVDAEAAVIAARAAQPGWARLSADERGEIFERAADLMELRRPELNALMILEAGKPWIEADADVSEAIDFCRYYTDGMRRLEKPTITQAVPGERCVQRWRPRGVGVVIAPWNFPLAILTGMTVAGAVTGNAVIMKPAEQTSIIAATLMGILREAGVPAGVINFVAGDGENVGAHLVAHPKVDFIAFTGSRAVGLKIWETAGRTLPGQASLKKAICEMGGKNPLIIDNDADLDEAIPAALYSAFGFSGQKCSALSRLVVLAGVYDRFVARLVEAAAAMPIGDPALPATMIGPVIDSDAQQKILSLIEKGQAEARLAFQSKLPSTPGGYFVPPTIFTEVKPDATIAREEIFGPVIAVIKVRDIDEAFAVANSSDYALTGGIFSRSPLTLKRAERELLAGNLYLNRTITGAVVERHPFGGFKMSGGGTKAGGTAYLENFLLPYAIAENIMRRGFTPEDKG